MLFYKIEIKSSTIVFVIIDQKYDNYKQYEE